jgi:D-tyrosyl-tRNA(Tyr) deacylase
MIEVKGTSMTREAIIRMAREAADETGTLIPSYWNDTLLERFAAIVAAAEREACAALVDENAMGCENPIYRSLLQSNAAAIRARGQA